MVGLVDIYDVIEKEVLNAYYIVLEAMEHGDVAPSLLEIFEEFYQNTLENIEEIYEEVFGEGTPIREEFVEDLGIDIRGIPNILVICRVLNAFKLGYMYNNVLYNMMPQKLLKEEVILDDYGYS